MAPSVPLALGLIVVYAAVFTAVAASSGIPYADWFASGSTAFRTAVLPLLAGAVVIVAFLWWARWDFVFRDPERLPVHRAYRVAMAAFVLGIVVHLVLVRWDRLTLGLLLAVLAAGVLVGFCEETLFRGVLLRSLLDGHRSETACLLISSAVFGLFHLTNVINGSPLTSALTQVALAAVTGAILYLFRRVGGLLLVGMVAHGLWDVSLFLPGGGGGSAGALVNVALLVVVPLLGVVAVLVSLRRDRQLVVGSVRATATT
ncbi:CPBP family intramembrane glutamic endopeptidase [Jannaschia sp. R86511]|uniref:CPBP family intramembrane glutamic endopeptidase n=1 Tax=Jannaschia sp. R86511 TaxID=3093853 RepID=UPI0036D4144B